MYVTVASLVKVVASTVFDISPSDGIALGMWCIGQLAWLAHGPFFALKHTLANVSFRVTERQIVPVIFLVVKQREFANQLIGGLADMILVLESLADLLSVDQGVEVTLVGKVTWDTASLVPVEDKRRTPWPIVGNMKDSIAPAIHCQAKRLALRGQTMNPFCAP